MMMGMSTEQTISTIILTPQSVIDALNEVQCRCTARTLTLADVEDACREAEDRMDHWGVPLSRRVRARMVLMPWYARTERRGQGTRVEMRRIARGWQLVSVERATETFGHLPQRGGVTVTVDASAADLEGWAASGPLAIRLAR